VGFLLGEDCPVRHRQRFGINCPHDNVVRGSVREFIMLIALDSHILLTVHVRQPTHGSMDHAGQVAFDKAGMSSRDRDFAAERVG
jgi:hypothetical protein